MRYLWLLLTVLLLLISVSAFGWEGWRKETENCSYNVDFFDGDQWMGATVKNRMLTWGEKSMLFDPILDGKVPARPGSWIQCGSGPRYTIISYEVGKLSPAPLLTPGSYSREQSYTSQTGTGELPLPSQETRQ